MGLFDDFDIDMDDVKAADGFSNPDDGNYDFEVTEAGLRNGTKKKPDDTFFVIYYSLDEAGSKQEWFTVAEDGERTARAKQSLGFLKSRLIDLGLEAASLNDISSDDLEGIRGTLQLVTTKNAKGEFQNIKNVKVAEAEDEDEDEPEVDDAALKKQVAAKRAARAKAEAAAKAPVKKRPAKPAPAEDDDEDENPFE